MNPTKPEFPLETNESSMPRMNPSEIGNSGILRIVGLTI